MVCLDGGVYQHQEKVFSQNAANYLRAKLAAIRADYSFVPPRTQIGIALSGPDLVRYTGIKSDLGISFIVSDMTKIDLGDWFMEYADKIHDIPKINSSVDGVGASIWDDTQKRVY